MRMTSHDIHTRWASSISGSVFRGTLGASPPSVSCSSSTTSAASRGGRRIASAACSAASPTRKARSRRASESATITSSSRPLSAAHREGEPERLRRAVLAQGPDRREDVRVRFRRPRRRRVLRVARVLEVSSRDALARARRPGNRRRGSSLRARWPRAKAARSCSRPARCNTSRHRLRSCSRSSARDPRASSSTSYRSTTANRS